QYILNATADISLFFGAWAWQGITSSRGTVTPSGPVPQNYTFPYASGSKRETVELRFNQRGAQDTIINPPPHPSSKHVPIIAAHLQNVVDPLSSAIVLPQARFPSQKDACNRRLPIFDGKVRYDLVLAPKTKRQVNSGNIHGMANVC